MPIYRHFTRGWPGLDFSRESELECYLQETFGETPTRRNNGYLLGKHWMDVTVAMWREDMPQGKGAFKWELYGDEFFKDHHWWLDKVLKGMPGSKE